MAPGLVNIDRNTLMLFPVDMRELLPDDHMVHFIIDAVDHLDLRNFKINWKWCFKSSKRLVPVNRHTKR